MRTLLVASLFLLAALAVPSADAAPGYGCEPTPHGMRCTGDLVVCTTYSGAEYGTSAYSYSGFDCGVVACDFQSYGGLVPKRQCSV